MNSSASIYIALGANKAHQGRKPAENLAAALDALPGMGIEVRAVSRAWRTPAWPDPSDPAFVNACAAVSTDLDPPALMAALHRVEAMFGRARTVPNAPRALDLDLIDHAGKVREGPEAPILPHPRATRRAFVLLPLFDIAPHWRDPLSGRHIEALIAALPDADREAAQPLGAVLCAAAPRLKPGAR